MVDVSADASLVRNAARPSRAFAFVRGNLLQVVAGMILATIILSAIFAPYVARTRRCEQTFPT